MDDKAVKFPKARLEGRGAALRFQAAEEIPYDPDSEEGEAWIEGYSDGILLAHELRVEVKRKAKDEAD